MAILLGKQGLLFEKQGSYTCTCMVDWYRHTADTNRLELLDILTVKLKIKKYLGIQSYLSKSRY